MFAGKAHPADTPGKELIQRIEQFARNADVRHRFVFLEDYDMAVARTMYHGCDVWLNNPRRPLEACGTSGMKAALNGALNCSILDGWWDECYDGTNGWAIASADDDPDLDRRDLREAGSLFAMLEHQIVPQVLRPRSRRRAARVGARWCATWASLGPQVTASRMVRDYTTALYEPAAASAGASPPTARGGTASWRPGGGASRRDGRRSPSRRSISTTARRRPAPTAPSTVAVELGDLTADDVRVEAVHGLLGHDGEFREPIRIAELQPTGGGTFTGEIGIGVAGSYGVSACAFPVHPDLASPFDVGRVAWAE